MKKLYIPKKERKKENFLDLLYKSWYPVIIISIFICVYTLIYPPHFTIPITTIVIFICLIIISYTFYLDFHVNKEDGVPMFLLIETLVTLVALINIISHTSTYNKEKVECNNDGRIGIVQEVVEAGQYTADNWIIHYPETDTEEVFNSNRCTLLDISKEIKRNN